MPRWVVFDAYLYYDKPNVIQAAGGGWFSIWQAMTYHYGWLQNDYGQWDKIFEPGYVTGASLMVRRKTIEEVGMMKESFFLYCEELEWQLRVKQRGWRIYYCPKSIIWHKESASVGVESPLREYYKTRNAIWIVRCFWFRAILPSVFFHLLRFGRRFIQGKWGNALAILRGIKDGVLGRWDSCDSSKKLVCTV
nr:glycosyltransferase family 2 protein [Desulfofundulus thermosubterraneus]